MAITGMYFSVKCFSGKQHLVENGESWYRQGEPHLISGGAFLQSPVLEAPLAKSVATLYPQPKPIFRTQGLSSWPPWELPDNLHIGSSLLHKIHYSIRQCFPILSRSLPPWIVCQARRTSIVMCWPRSEGQGPATVSERTPGREFLGPPPATPKI